MASKTKVIGVWDDHDYGNNNGGGSFALKVPMKELFLEFLDEPQDSPVR
jgi:alkaline phosphatase D